MPIENKEGKKVLTEDEMRLVAYIEEQFWLHNITPPVGNISEALGFSLKWVLESLENETIREYLHSRAVHNPLTELVPSDGLSAQQLFCANILLNAQDKSSLREKLKLAKVSSQQYYAWLNDPKFRDYLQARAERIFTASEWQVRQALTDNAVGGDTAAIKFYMELVGKYIPRMDHNINIEGMLSQVIEIVSYFLDQKQMVEFANMIEILLQTGTVPKKEDSFIEARIINEIGA